MKKLIVFIVSILAMLGLFTGCAPEMPNDVKLEIATTTGDVGGSYEERIRSLYQAGFKNVDLSLYDLSTGDVLMEENWKDTTDSLKTLANELGMTFVQAHLPKHNPFFNSYYYDFSVRIAIRAIEVCGELGIKEAVIHFGYANYFTKEQAFEKNKQFINDLLPTAVEYGVNILCENSTVKNMGSTYYPNSGADMLEFIEYVDHPNLHACWDTGHGNLEEGSQYDDIVALGDHLRAIHFNDNAGDRDTHLMPYYGSMNVKDVMRALNVIDFKGYFTLESTGGTRANGTYKGPQFSDVTDYNPTDRLEQEKLLYKITERILIDYDMLKVA